MPASVNELATVFTLLDHWYAVPVPVASTSMAVVVQVSNVVPVMLLILTVGASIFCVNVIFVVLEHPLSSVTVTV